MVYITNEAVPELRTIIDITNRFNRLNRLSAKPFGFDFLGTLRGLVCVPPRTGPAI